MAPSLTHTNKLSKFKRSLFNHLLAAVISTFALRHLHDKYRPKILFFVHYSTFIFLSQFGRLKCYQEPPTPTLFCSSHHKRTGHVYLHLLYACKIITKTVLPCYLALTRAHMRHAITSLSVPFNGTVVTYYYNCTVTASSEKVFDVAIIFIDQVHSISSSTSFIDIIFTANPTCSLKILSVTITLSSPTAP